MPLASILISILFCSTFGVCIGAEGFSSAVPEVVVIVLGAADLLGDLATVMIGDLDTDTS